MTLSHARWHPSAGEPLLALKSLRAPNGAFFCRCHTSHSFFLCPRSRCKPSSCVWLRNCDVSTIRFMRTCKMTLSAKDQASMLFWSCSVLPKLNGGAPARQCSLTRHRCFAMAFSTGSRTRRSPSGTSGLAQFLQLDQRILHYLLENDALDGRLDGYATLLPPAATLEQVLVDPALKAGMVNLCQRWFAQQSPGRQPVVLYFQGPHGVGKQDLAMGLCAQRGRPLCTSICHSSFPVSRMSRQPYGWFVARGCCGALRSISTWVISPYKKTGRRKSGCARWRGW